MKRTTAITLLLIICNLGYGQRIDLDSLKMCNERAEYYIVAERVSNGISKEAFSNKDYDTAVECLLESMKCLKIAQQYVDLFHDHVKRFVEAVYRMDIPDEDKEEIKNQLVNSIQ